MLLQTLLNVSKAQNNSMDTCLFSEDRQYALVYEFKNFKINETEIPLFGLFKLGQNNTFDSLIIVNDSVYFINNHQGIVYKKDSIYLLKDSFNVLKSISKSNFFEKYNFNIKGIDVSKKINYQFDSVFVRRGYPMLDGCIDTNYKETNFYNFYISFSLFGKVLHLDTLYSTNIKSSDQLEWLNQTEEKRVYDMDSVFVGTVGKVSKIFTDSTLQSVFIRTHYLGSSYESHGRINEVEVIDPVTKQLEIQTVYAVFQRGEEPIYIRKLIKK